MQRFLADIPTIERRSIETGGRSTGFDYLRFILASSIILVHTVIVSYGLAPAVAFQRSPPGLVFSFVLPMFFALSGFLVAGSLERSPTLVSFYALRVLRIVPALGVEITLSALIFGPLLTSLVLRDYFASPMLWAYFLNIVGDIHFYLPGLFAGNPLPRFVNAQLWTIPYELQCYLVLGILGAVGVMRRPALLLLLTCIGQLFWVLYALKTPDDITRAPIASGSDLVISFMFGLVFHLYRKRIPMHWALFCLAAAVGYGLALLPHGGFYLPLPATYMTVYLGLLNPRKSSFLAGGDYSYGLFLYGYPIQQAVASLGPWAQHWYINLLLAFPVALGVAVLSWHSIEKPALGLRRFIPAFERRAVGMALPRGEQVGGLGASLGQLAGFGAFCAAVLGVLALIDGHERLGMFGIVAGFLGCYAAAALRRGALGRAAPASS